MMSGCTRNFSKLYIGVIKLVDLTPRANEIRKAVNVRATTVGDVM